MAALTCGLSVWMRRTESRSQGGCQFLEGGQLVDAGLDAESTGDLCGELGVVAPVR